MAERFRFEPLGDLWPLIVTFNKDTWSDRGSLRCLTTPGAGAGQKYQQYLSLIAMTMSAIDDNVYLLGGRDITVILL